MIYSGGDLEEEERELVKREKERGRMKERETQVNLFKLGLSTPLYLLINLISSPIF